MGFAERLRLLYVACTRASITSWCPCTARRELPGGDSRLTSAELLWYRGSADACRERDQVQLEPVCRAPVAAPPAPIDARHLARRARRRVRDRRAAPVRVGDRARAARRRCRGRRSRRRQGGPRPRAAAVEQGPLRDRDRPRGARGAPDRRPRDRRRPRRPGRRAGRGRRRARASRRRSPSSCSRRSTARRCAPRAPRSTGARPTWRCRSRGSPSRATSTSCIRDARAARRARPFGGRRLQDRRDRDRHDARGPRHGALRVQGAAYAIAVATATGARVDRCVFVFLSPGGVREVEIVGPELARPRSITCAR